LKGKSFLEDRWFQDKDPIDWSRIERENGILSMYRDVIALRRNRSGVTRGLCGQNIHIYHVDNEAKVIAFHRSDKDGPKDSVIVVVNMTNQIVMVMSSVFHGQDCGKRALTVTLTTMAQF
jgi:1,4-alpha-glucan branching enzyme